MGSNHESNERVGGLKKKSITSNYLSRPESKIISEFQKIKMKVNGQRPYYIT